jgi:hypothetical protein
MVTENSFPRFLQSSLEPLHIWLSLPYPLRLVRGHQIMAATLVELMRSRASRPSVVLRPRRISATLQEL